MIASGSSEQSFVDLTVPMWVWAAFLAFVVALLLVDLLVLHRHVDVVSGRRALAESVGWIALGLVFGVVVWLGFGAAAAGEYYAGYLLEKSLSVDNVFVWALIMTYFAVPRAYQHRVLFWGIFGALVLRAVFIFAGVALLERFEWVILVFGAFLLYTAVKLLRSGDDDHIDPASNVLLRWFRKVVPSSTEYHGHHLFAREAGRRVATPLFAVLVVVETSDVLFAVDSIPAILGVTREQFIVFSSNAFAILGLRALYFLVADLHDRFRYLQHGLAVILAFVGVKMLVSPWVHLPTWLSLSVIVIVLVVAIVLSARAPLPASEEQASEEQHRS